MDEFDNSQGLKRNTNDSPFISNGSSGYRKDSPFLSPDARSDSIDVTKTEGFTDVGRRDPSYEPERRSTATRTLVIVIIFIILFVFAPAITAAITTCSLDKPEYREAEQYLESKYDKNFTLEKDGHHSDTSVFFDDDEGNGPIQVRLKNSNGEKFIDNYQGIIYEKQLSDKLKSDSDGLHIRVNAYLHFWTAEKFNSLEEYVAKINEESKFSSTSDVYSFISATFLGTGEISDETLIKTADVLAKKSGLTPSKVRFNYNIDNHHKVEKEVLIIDGAAVNNATLDYEWKG